VLIQELSRQKAFFPMAEIQEMADKESRIFGAHMSISGGVPKSVERGASIDLSAMQIFTKNSNQWNAKPFSEEDVKTYRENISKSGIKYVASHDSYLINLASPDKTMYEKSLNAFLDEIERAGKLGIRNLVFHPGSHMGSGEDAGLGKVADAMNEAIERTAEYGDVVLTIETTAGQGTNLGYDFEHIAALIKKVDNKKRVGVCVDTCHIFAAGYELRNAEGYKKTFGEFDRIIGVDKIALFHVNDSKKDLGSRVDRHEHIGKGFIGLEAFRLLLGDKRFFKTPMIIETPKGKEMEEDIENLKVLKSLL